MREAASEVHREAIRIPAKLLIQPLGGYSVNGSEVAIQYDPQPADRIYQP